MTSAPRRLRSLIALACCAMAGVASSTWWPRSSSSLAVSTTALTHSGCTGVPMGEAVEKPIFSLPVLAPTSCANGRCGIGQG